MCINQSSGIVSARQTNGIDTTFPPRSSEYVAELSVDERRASPLDLLAYEDGYLPTRGGEGDGSPCSPLGLC